MAIDHTSYVQEIVLGPSGMATLEVARYQSDTPAPQFQVELDTSRPDMIGMTLEHIEQADNQTAMVYYFQNFAKNHCRVVIKAAL